MKFKILSFLLSWVLSMNSAMAMYSSFEILSHIADHHAEDANLDILHHHSQHSDQAGHEHKEVFNNSVFEFHVERVFDDDQQPRDSSDQHSHALPSAISLLTLLPIDYTLIVPTPKIGSFNFSQFKSAIMPTPYLSSIFRPPSA